ENDELSSACVPQVPPALAVPAGNKLAFYYDAVGVQIYGCDTTATGYGWVLRGPDANLYGHKGKLAGTHYVGPTWQSTDGSTVVGTKLADAPSPDATAIAWLLLGATSHTGQGRMSDVTYIQRLETAGGKAPSSGCDASHIGEKVLVPYTSSYFFYRPAAPGEAVKQCRSAPPRKAS
ncbi:MAG TPA: DUF3455 domain-containing protein, partial [Polyangiaceae bacterium]|nr:DUF3455 domain-containing protein [Polyangiaceae bacterium]